MIFPQKRPINFHMHVFMYVCIYVCLFAEPFVLSTFMQLPKNLLSSQIDNSQ